MDYSIFFNMIVDVLSAVFPIAFFFWMAKYFINVIYKMMFGKVEF